MLLRLEKKQQQQKKVVLLVVQVSPAQLDKKTQTKLNEYPTSTRSEFKYSVDAFMLKLPEITKRSRLLSSAINISVSHYRQGEQIRLSPKLEHI